MGNRGKARKESGESLNEYKGTKGKSHKFKGKSTTSHEYSSAGLADMLEFFQKNSNYDELLAGLDSRGRDYMDVWTRGHFMHGQQYQGWDNMSAEDRRYTKFYDDLIEKSTINQGITVSRLATTELLFGERKYSVTEDELKAVMGNPVTSRGHMSSGAAEVGLTIGSYKPIEYKFITKGATKGVAMYIGDYRATRWGSDQREVMIQRDTVWKPTGYKYDKDRDVWVVNMEYVGKERHDYGKSKK